MSVLARALVPAVALGLGTWLGLGRPDAQAAMAAGARAIASVTAAAREVAPPTGPGRSSPGEPGSPAPPLDKPPATIDPSDIPDPSPPWPRLNPDDTVDRAWLVAEGPVHAHDDGRRLVTFTFDDGPFPETAPTVLRLLAEHRIRATFFFIGEYLLGDGPHAVETREWARKIAEAGHYIGNHTMHHKPLTGLSHATALAEIDDSAAAIERATGRRPLLFRPPYGALNPFLEGALRERHLELLLWNVDIEDMKKQDPDEMLESLQGALEYTGGGIVLLHDMHWPSVKAFNRLVKWLDTNKWDPKHPDHFGWSVVDLPEYLRATAAAPQPYATREELEKARRAINERAAR
jgi:peptidoglycan/xylan/chitin deacetylase (PgdA/CDA1 family)